MPKRLTKTESHAIADAMSSPLSSRRSPRLRQRVAWMYYVEDMTQSQIAAELGIGRITVVRLLSEARALNDVRISLSRDIEELSGLEVALQKHFDIPEAIVAPRSSASDDSRSAVAAAAGEFVSSMLRPEMKIGLGWGRTLNRMLGFIIDRRAHGLSVVSLLGGITRAREANPAEFAWQFSRIFMADCYMLAAPAIVDTAATKEALIERCGLKEVFDFSKSLDAIVVGVGSTHLKTSDDFYGIVREPDLKSVCKLGAVGDILYNFFDIEGRLVEHNLNERSMSIPLSTLCAVPNRVLVAAGLEKIEAIIGGVRLLRPTVLVTDEISAKALLAQSQSPKASPKAKRQR